MLKTEIEIRFVCECGSKTEPVESGHLNGDDGKKSAIVLEKYNSFICAKCGKIMFRKIFKISTETTETIVKEKQNGIREKQNDTN